MKVAIMQPYFFPYYLYWKMISEVDKFIILDDVSFIKKGYINRNYIKAAGKPKRFGISIKKISQNRAINQHELASDHFGFGELLKESYKEAAHFEAEEKWLMALMASEEKNLALYLENLLLGVSKRLWFNTEIELSSKIDPEKKYKGEDRIIKLCSLCAATDYYNLPGGRSIYTAEKFQNAGLNLNLLHPAEESYRQVGTKFVPNLSIVDHFFNMGTDGTKHYLENIRGCIS